MPGSCEAAEPDHRPQLDTLRCLAFALVFIEHARITNLTIGYYGVFLFFVISGFVITRTLLRGTTGDLKHDLRAFYARRALRILPL
ncbi:acyltransferase family protein, partial [Staphylococcus aureus]